MDHTLSTLKTPYYLYDKQEILAQSQRLTSLCLPGVSQVLYSLKANPNPALVDTIVDQGIGCDVSSEFELEVALSSQVPRNSIGCVGPHKSTSLLHRCLANNIAFIAVESLEELTEIGQLKQGIDSATPIILRINPDIDISGGSMKMGGAASQFGLSETDLPQALALACDMAIPLSGIHVYSTTRVLNAGHFIENVSALCAYLIRIKAEHNLPTNILNLGGGFGIPYYKGESELDLLSIRQAMLDLQTLLVEKTGVERIFFESGRYIVGTSGKAVIQVQSIKQSGAKKYAVCDGGYNIFHSATAFGNLVRKPYLMNKQSGQRTLESNPMALDEELFTLVGPLCTPSDIIADKFRATDLQVGDRIEIHHVGAYSLTCSPGLFIGHGFPAEYLLEEGKLSKIGQEDDYQSMSKRYINQPHMQTD